MKKAIVIIVIAAGAYLCFFTNTFSSLSKDEAASSDTSKVDSTTVILKADSAKNDTVKK